MRVVAAVRAFFLCGHPNPRNYASEEALRGEIQNGWRVALGSFKNRAWLCSGPVFLCVVPALGVRKAEGTGHSDRALRCSFRRDEERPTTDTPQIPA